LQKKDEQNDMLLVFKILYILLLMF